MENKLGNGRSRGWRENVEIYLVWCEICEIKIFRCYFSFIIYLEIREIMWRRIIRTQVESSCRTLKIVTLRRLQALHSAASHAPNKACGCCASTYFPALFGAARSCGGGFADLYQSYVPCPFMPMSCKQMYFSDFLLVSRPLPRESGENDGNIPRILEKL